MKLDKKFFQYFKAYQWSNIFAMIKNGFLDPKIHPEEFTGKLVVITGATSGIGYVTAKKYASMGANLLCINRNKQRSDDLVLEIENEYGVSCKYLLADLSRLPEIKRVADELEHLKTPIDVLICNAGVYLTKREVTPDGLELVLAVHHISSFIITHQLMEKLKSQESARIILVGSEGHRFAAWGLDLDDMNWDKRRYSGLKSYGSAKLAQMLTMLVFDEMFINTGVTINAVHPGAVKTDTGQENGQLYRWFKRNFLDKGLKSSALSAEALYYLGASKEVEGVSGKFFNLTTEEIPAPPALDIQVAYEVWGKSLELSGLEPESL
jgi:retinol dehydrogenase-13